MVLKELAEQIAKFKFEGLGDAHEALMKACDVFKLSLDSARRKGMEALSKNRGAWEETKKNIKFEDEFLNKLDAETLYGVALNLYDLDDVLEPWKYYEKAFRKIMKLFAEKYDGEDKLNSYRKRKQDRRDSSTVGKWRKRRAARLDAKWITVGATPEDKEAGIPAGKGRHVLIDDEGEVISGAGGSLAGVKLSEAESTSEEVSVDPAKVSTAATGEGKSMSGAEPTKTEEPKTEPEEPKVEPKDEKKLKIVSTSKDFKQALEEAKTKEERQAILDKMPACSTITFGSETYRKKTNGEWVLSGHKAPKDIAGFDDWSDIAVRSAVEVFKDAASKNLPEFIESMLRNYAVGTIIKLRKDGDMALERKKSGWIVTSGGEYYGIGIPTGTFKLKDLSTWKNLAETMDNWYVKRKKDGEVETKEPSKDLLDKFDAEADEDDKDYQDLLEECDVGTTIDVDGDTYKCVGKDTWEHDTEGKEYEIGDVSWLADKANKAANLYVGSHKVSRHIDLTEARKKAKADYEKYTTPEYLKTVPSLKHYDEKVDEVRKTRFKAFSDAEIKEANEILAKLFDQAEYCARFDSHKIDAFIEKGLLNQFDTGTTHGFHDPGHGMRFRASEELFGTELKKGTKYVSGKEFEKYGFMSDIKGLKSGGDASWYGDGCLIFDKDAVKDRATYTYKDSLAGSVTPGRAGEPPTVYGMLGGWGDISVDKKNSFMDKLRKMKTWDDLRKSGYIDSYCEMQYHGKMPISTVKEIILYPGTKISEEGQKKLDEYGIIVTYKYI